MIGKVIDYQAKQMTYNVYSYFKKRKLDRTTPEYRDDINLIDTVSEATGLSKSSVTRIISEGNSMNKNEGDVIFNPQEKKKHTRKKRILVDEITEGVIRRKVIQFYTVKNEVPSVRRLNQLLKEEKILKCSDEYLRVLLHKLGFTNAESDSTGMLRERADIVSERLSYLQAMKAFRDQNRNIFFFNETERWGQQDNTDTNIPKNMPRIVIVHVNGDIGFLDGTLLMIKKATKSEKDCEIYENHVWVKNYVLKNIPSHSVIVMNNSVCGLPVEKVKDEHLTVYSIRASMENWLNSHSIAFKETDSKADLFELIKMQENKTKYSIAKLITENGHDVLNLPTNHSDLNPAAIVWEEIKGSAVKASPQKILTEYPKSKWEEKFEYVKQNEIEYFAHDIQADVAEHVLQLKTEKQDEEDENELILKAEPESDGMDSDF